MKSANDFWVLDGDVYRYYCWWTILDCYGHFYHVIHLSEPLETLCSDGIDYSMRKTHFQELVYFHMSIKEWVSWSISMNFFCTVPGYSKHQLKRIASTLPDFSFLICLDWLLLLFDWKWWINEWALSPIIRVITNTKYNCFSVLFFRQIGDWKFQSNVRVL